LNAPRNSQLVGVPSPKPSGDYFTYDKYYSFLSTEYVTDDFIEVVRSKAFLQDVQKEMGAAPATPLSVVSLPRTERAPRTAETQVSSTISSPRCSWAPVSSDFFDGD